MNKHAVHHEICGELNLCDYVDDQDAQALLDAGVCRKVLQASNEFEPNIYFGLELLPGQVCPTCNFTSLP